MQRMGLGAAEGPVTGAQVNVHISQLAEHIGEYEDCSKIVQIQTHVQVY